MLTSFHIQEVLVPKYKDVENSLAHAVKWTVPEKIRSQSFPNHSVQIAESIQRHTYINPIHKSSNFSSVHSQTRSSIHIKPDHLSTPRARDFPFQKYSLFASASSKFRFKKNFAMNFVSEI